jgi:hypothetical protein
MNRDHSDAREDARELAATRSVVELAVLSLVAATCCVAASSLHAENFPILFAAISLLTAITALRRCLTT